MINRNRNTKPYLISAAILLFFVAVGVFSVLHLIRYEQQRDLNNWQLTLSVVADSRAAEIMQWSDSRFAVLRELAANGALQLYAQQLLSSPEMKRETEAVQLSYLRNLIQTTGQRSGFYDDPKSNMTAPANIAFYADNGLALLAPGGELITSTPGLALPDAPLKEAISRVITSGTHLFCDIRRNENSQPIAGFLVPVFPLQKQSDNQPPIAVLYGFTNAATSLFKILDHRSLATKTAETILVRLDGNLITYISPLADGTAPLTLQLAANADDLVAASVLRSPGRFSQGFDYAGSRSLFTSRVLSGMNMMLIQKISYAEALAESQSHQRFLLVALLMALLLCAALMVAAWWYGTSVKERQTARDLLDKSSRLEAQSNLLNAINDNMTDFILLLDHQSCLIFANKALAAELETAADALQGKSLANIFGPEAGRTLQELVKNAAAGHKMITREISFDIRGDHHLFISTCLPVGYECKGYDSVLITLHDVTLLQEAQAKKERLMKQIVGALMRAIDLHDPHSANHSAKTANVATAVGRAMDLSGGQLATIETAATLCNLGKLSLPREILLKTGELTAAEQAALQGETASAAAILADIEFDGPVLETICQKNEYLDGSGYPKGLAGETILLTSRILAAANAFVAMTSPRAYRDRLPAREAMDQLLAAADSKYDRHVVAALFHVVENEISTF
ncbi:MAG: PAS domain-containing protein [Deltaproteobacteria bacterium]|nr:PAS domain-containing protein [Deltaproteobacteria bacterium]